ncbi:von Willebrand factor type A [Paenibacillus alvei A6-6i-x]|nr:von Willebrand factor type A [Paenibacillus alvei A6-6i-x]
MKRSLSMLLTFVLMVSGIVAPGQVQGAASDYVQVNRTITPAEISTKQEATVELNVQGTPPVSVIKPNDVILVIDKSGSMKTENKMEAAKEAANGFIDLMDLSVHRVGVVDYSSQNNIGVSKLTADASQVKSYISGITANGGTATGSAIDTAIAELQRDPREGAQPVILILTDGDATEPGPDPYGTALKMAEKAKEAGIVFYTIALLNKNDNPDTSGPNLLLRKMATTFDHHHFVLGSVGLKDIYGAIVKEIGIASAYDVKVTEYVNEKFELVPDSYLDNIPQPTVEGNKLTWSFKELKNKTLKFTYKIRPKTQAETGIFNTSTNDSIVTYKDYAGADRSKLITNSKIKVKWPAPEITSIIEPSGHPKGGNTIEITGDNFKTGVRVLFNNAESKDVTYVDEQHLKVVVPEGKQGAVTVTVTNTDGQSASGTYKYIAKPEVTDYSPNEGLITGGTQVAFSGNYFAPNISVKFGDQAATVNTNRTNYLSVTTPAAAQVGKVDIVLTNPDGSSLTIAEGFTYKEPEKPKLEITSVAPDKGLPAGGEEIYINGRNIEQGAKVYFGATEAEVVSYISRQRILIKSPAGTKGSVDVKVVNPDTKEAMLPNGFTYQNPEYLPPTLSGITPDSGEMTGGNTVYITGSNFVSGIKAFINNKEGATTFMSPSRISVVVPSSDTAATVDVKVVNPDLKEAELKNSYTYMEPAPIPQPVLKALTPSKGDLKGGTSVTVNGENFIKDAVVLFNDVEMKATFVSDKQLKMTTPEWATPEVVKVTVKNPDGQTSVEDISFTYEEPQPEPVSITLINPASGLTTGGNRVYLNGKNFKSGVKVLFGNQEGKVDSVSGTRIAVVVPAVTNVQTVDVTVINPDKGTFTVPNGYAYTLVQPSISSITPNKGPMEGGTNITINGINFEADMTVTFNGVQVPIDSFTNTRIKVKSPANLNPGNVPVIITLANGESATTSFTYEAPVLGPAPIINFLSATSGPAAGGDTIYINAKNLVSGSKVYFGDTEALSVRYISQIRMSAVVPPGMGSLEVKVVNPDGQESNKVTYTYN